METLLLIRPTQRRHRPDRGRWPKLEKALVVAFAERRKESNTVRKKWFERAAKALFLQLYPDSMATFMMPLGWFNRFLSRNEIAIRIVTNKAQQPPKEYCIAIIGFLCFNRRDSQLRDGNFLLLVAFCSRTFSIWIKLHCFGSILKERHMSLKGQKLFGLRVESLGGINGKQEYS